MQVGRRSTKIVSSVLGFALIGALGAAPLASATGAPGITASYQGGTIDISNGWGSATVCAVTDAGTHCFSSQGAYQSWVAAQSVSNGSPSPLTALTNCSTGLDLYQDVNYGGDELVLYVTATWINLSTYSFSDELSSFKVGACAAGMTDAPNGGGTAYPGDTSAGSDVSTLGSSWNDRMQSVYIS